MLENNTVEIPGEGIEIRSGRLSISQLAKPAYTLATTVDQFEMIRHLLSDRPLRRPNRTRPMPGP